MNWFRKSMNKKGVFTLIYIDYMLLMESCQRN